MGILKVFNKGFKTTNKRPKMLIYLWLVNFVFSVLIITPVYFLLKKFTSHSLMADQIGKKLDFIWLGDVFFKYKDFSPILMGLVIIPAILYFFLYIFLNGGIIGRITTEEGKINLANFFGDCGKYFWRFFRVFLISLPIYLIIFGGLYRILSLSFKAWTKGASTEWPLIISSNLKFLIVLLLFSVFRMFFDYIKIRLVVEDSKKTLKGTLSNFSFIGKRFFRAWFLYLLVGFVVLVFGVVFLGVCQLIPQTGFLILVAFLWQQIYILSKMWTKILFFATEYHFLREKKMV